MEHSVDCIMPSVPSEHREVLAQSEIVLTLHVGPSQTLWTIRAVVVGVDPPDNPDARVRPVVDDGGARMQRLKGWI